MIAYDSSSWSDTLRRWHGTVLKHTWFHILGMLTIFVTVRYSAQALEYSPGEVHEHMAMIGHLISLLLVFRANSAYTRYVEGQHCLSMLVSNIRQFAGLTSTKFRGGAGQHLFLRHLGEEGFSVARRAALDDEDDRRASEARVHVVRYALALAVAFQIHLRMAQGHLWGSIDQSTKHKLNWDRMRLRTLLYREEFEVVDRALRVEDTEEEEALYWASGLARPHLFHQRETMPTEPRDYEVSTEPWYRQVNVLLVWIVLDLIKHTNEPHGFRERFVSEFVKLSTAVLQILDTVNQIIATPLPLPYTNLARTLVIAFFCSLAAFMDYRHGIWANVVMPTMACVALFGIDQVSTELENPFGDDDNDLDMQEVITLLEKENMRTLEIIGDLQARQSFVWLPVPGFIQEETKHPHFWYIALRQEVAHLDLPPCKNPNLTSCRTRIQPVASLPQL